MFIYQSISVLRLDTGFRDVEVAGDFDNYSFPGVVSESLI